MGWTLASGTGFCETGGELVFLDLARDRYLTLRGDDRAAFERLLRREPNDSEAMGRIVATGLLVQSEGPTHIEPLCASVPARDLAADTETPASLRMGFAAMRALRWARRAMRPERIAGTVAALGAAKIRLGVPGAETAVRRVAAAYAASRWIAATPPRCLVDALALDRILVARGLSVQLVFGVHLAPFAAHCWLQTPEVVLTGTAAEARNFKPILVIG